MMLFWGDLISSNLVFMIKKIVLSANPLFKFGLNSFLSFLIDFLIFSALYRLFGGLFFPLVTARLISGGFNFWQNKLFVYNAGKSGRVKKEVSSYFVLAIMVFSLGYVLISLFVLRLHVEMIVAKIIVDAILFLSNYLLQKRLIFLSTKKAN